MIRNGSFHANLSLSNAYLNGCLQNLLYPFSDLSKDLGVNGGVMFAYQGDSFYKTNWEGKDIPVRHFIHLFDVVLAEFLRKTALADVDLADEEEKKRLDSFNEADVSFIDPKRTVPYGKYTKRITTISCFIRKTNSRPSRRKRSIIPI